MRKILRALAIAYGIYLGLAILVILPVLNFVPAWYMQETFGRKLHTEIILFNPFTLSLEVRKAELPELDGQRFAALDRASVNLSLESMWWQGWVLDAVQVQGLFVHVRRLSDGQFNFSDLLASDTEAEAAADEGSGVPGLTIHDFDFDSESIVVSDETRETPYSTHWDGLAIDVSDLSTVIEEGRPYRIDAYGEGGGSLHWEGEVSVPGAHSEGHLTLSGLRLRTLWRFAEPWLALELRDGRLNMEAHYRIDWQQALDYRLWDGEVSIETLDIAPKAAVDLADTAVQMTELSISGISADSRTLHAAIAAINIDELWVAGWSEGSSVSLAQLFEVNLPSNSSTDVEPAAAAPQESDAGWTAQIDSIHLHGALDWRSEFTDPPLLQVNPVEATVENLNWPLAGDSPMSLQLVINKLTSLSIDGALALETGDGRLNYDLQGLPVPWVNPNLPKALNAIITDGEVNIAGQVNLAEFTPTTLQLDGDISDFSGKMLEAKESLTSWEAVSWEQLKIDMQQRTVSMDRLSFEHYSGRVHIRKDGSINAQNIWVEEVGEEAQELAEDLSLDEPWKVSIPHIVVSDSAIDFMDESLPIKFRTVIGQLNGEIIDISTAADKQARVDMRGSVDGYAPVLLQGTAQPFLQPPNLDLKLGFDGVDLALLTPYSGTYAGYAIDRGLLNLDLQYTLQESQLAGHNSVVIDQLKLGEKVDSDKAADIPLQLALALLTDSKGVIDLQVPVSGNIDDPSFAIGSVISGAFINLITKAVTAPFSLLANLVGSEEDLQRLSFPTGSAQLNEAGTAKLTQLSTALQERPALQLVVTGRLNLAADRERLQQMALRQTLLDAGMPQAEIDGKGSDWEKAISKRYQALPPSPGTSDGSPLSLRQQYDALVAAIEIPDHDLLELAEARAVAVKAFLVNDAQLDPGRAVIEQASLADEQQSFSGVELSLGN